MKQKIKNLGTSLTRSNIKSIGGATVGRVDHICLKCLFSEPCCIDDRAGCMSFDGTFCEKKPKCPCKL